MPKLEKNVYGAPCWVDLTSGDLAAVKPFYSALFNWEYEEMGDEFGNYNMISVGDDVVGGAMQYSAEFMGPEEINSWSIYFATEDIKAALKSAQDNGGQAVMDPMEIPTQGFMSNATDANGTMYGLWQPTGLRGFSRFGEHGFPGWFELHTRGYDAAVKYYADAFGVEVKNMEMGPDDQYSTIEVNGESQAGIFDATPHMPEGAPSMWLIYFIVDDTDAAVATAKEHGGTVLSEPEDSPFGRMAFLQDPKGAPFFVISGDEA